jgi:hypothetical protein
MFMSAAGIYDGIDGTGSFTPGLDTTNRTANLGAGSCLIKGQLWNATATVKTPIPAASAADRFDRLVVRLSRAASTSATVVSPAVITGASGGGMPPLQQTPTGLWDIPVSYWTSHANGTIDTMVDQRQYCGRSVVSMTSGYHPSPTNPRIGLETDTQNILTWDGSNWNPIAAGNLLAYSSTAPLGDIGAAWTDQASISFTLTASTTVMVSSYISGTQVTTGPATVHVHRITVDGVNWEIGRDRNIPNADPSCLGGTWNGVLAAGNHTIKNTVYSSSNSWRINSATIMAVGY